MSYAAAPIAPHPNAISPYMRAFVPAGVALLNMRAGQIATVVYPNAQVAFYYPFAMNTGFLVKRVWWSNETVSGNVDCGVYDSTCTTKLFSAGSTAMSGANAMQSVDITDYDLPAGRYYLGFWCSNTTASFKAVDPGTNGAALLNASGALIETGLASGLPSTATPVVPSGTNDQVWYCGIGGGTLLG